MPQQPFAEKSIAPCSCAWVQARLFAYLDGTLQTAERARWQAHADACPHCQNELAQARRAESALNQVRNSVPPAGDLRSGFYAKLAQTESAQRPARRFGWAVAAPALAAVLLTVVVVRQFAPMTPSASNGNPSSAPIVAEVSPAEQAHNTPMGGLPNITDKQPETANAVRTLAQAVPPKQEKLTLAQAELPKRLPKQELRRVLRSAPAVAMNTPTTARSHFRKTAVDILKMQADTPVEVEAKSLALRHSSGLMASSGLKEEAETDREKAILFRESRQDTRAFGDIKPHGEGLVRRVALTDGTDDDGETYLEVNDDTRNFRFSTRLASVQDSEEEGIELFVSDDATAESAENADGETK